MKKNKKKISAWCLIPCAIIWFIIGGIVFHSAECPYNHLTLMGTLENHGIDNVDKETNKSYREMYIFAKHDYNTYAIYTLPKRFNCGCNLK